MVLSVLGRRLYDGADRGVVFHAGLRSEVSADLELGFSRSERLLAVVVRGRDGRIREEGEDVVPVLDKTLLEFVQLGFLPVFLRIDWRLEAWQSVRSGVLPSSSSHPARCFPCPPDCLKSLGES